MTSLKNLALKAFAISLPFLGSIVLACLFKLSDVVIAVLAMMGLTLSTLLWVFIDMGESETDDRSEG